MPLLYRVFPHLVAAEPDEPGGALYLPSQGGGRLDNPDLYALLYLSNARAGAIAEAFGRFSEWSGAMLTSPSLPNSRRSIATYSLPEEVAVCDLDDPKRLAKLELRPSQIVSRDYSRTRDWARRIYRDGSWSGVSWWSYYDSRWSSFGLWDTSKLRLEEVRPIELDDADLQEAARVIARQVVVKKLRR